MHILYREVLLYCYYGFRNIMHYNMIFNLSGGWRDNTWPDDWTAVTEVTFTVLKHVSECEPTSYIFPIEGSE